MDLKPFALFSTKIPAYFLAPTQSRPRHFANITALAIDALCVVTITFMMNFFIEGYVNLNLSKISSKFESNITSFQFAALYFSTLLSYFSVCLIACDGMSLGTRFIKRRIYSENTFRTAVKWTFATFSFGLLYPLIKQSFQEDENRYSALMSTPHQDTNLLRIIECQKVEVPEYELQEVA